MRRVPKPMLFAIIGVAIMLAGGFASTAIADPAGDAILGQILAAELKNFAELAQITQATVQTLRTARETVGEVMLAKEIGESVLSLDGQRTRAIAWRAVDTAYPDAAYLRDVAENRKNAIPLQAYGSLDSQLVECSTKAYRCGRFGEQAGSECRREVDPVTGRLGKTGAELECDALRDLITGRRSAMTLAVAYGIDERQMDPATRRAFALTAASTNAAAEAGEKAQWSKKMETIAQWKEICEGKSAAFRGKSNRDACTALQARIAAFQAEEAAETNRTLKDMMRLQATQVEIAAAERQHRMQAAREAQRASVAATASMDCMLTGRGCPQKTAAAAPPAPVPAAVPAGSGAR